MSEKVSFIDHLNKTHTIQKNDDNIKVQKTIVKPISCKIVNLNLNNITYEISDIEYPKNYDGEKTDCQLANSNTRRFCSL